VVCVHDILLVMRNLNYNHLLYFYTTVNSGSLKNAAESLKLSPSTVSEQIAELEQYFGKTLLRRQKGKLSLTEHGQTAYQYARTIFTAGERLKSTLKGTEDRAGEPIEIGVNSTVTKLFERALFLPLFKDEQTKFRLRVGELNNLVDDLFAFSLDIVLTDREIRESKGIKSEIVQHPSYSIVAHPDLKPEGFKYPEDLNKLPFIHYTIYSGVKWEIDQFFIENNVKPSLIGEVDDTEIMKHAVCDGLCFGILPTALVQKELDRGELVTLGSVKELDVKVYAYYHDNDPTKKIHSVIDYLKKKNINH
jgi:LysR family transcriptional regulator, transcriptional activator of nhaA